MSHDPMFSNTNSDDDFRRSPGFSGGYPNVEPPQFPNPNQPQQPQWSQPQHSAPTPPKKSRKGLKIAGGVVGALLLLGIGSAMGSDDTEAKKTVSAVPAESATTYAAPTTGWNAPRLAPAPVAPAATGYKQNKLLTIGVDIQPGTYAYEVPEDAFMGFLWTCTVGSDCNSAMTADNSEMFSAGESGQYTVPASGYIKLDDVHLTPIN